MDIFKPLHTRVPEACQAPFAAYNELHNANRLHILAYINITVYLLLYIVDFVRYTKGELFNNTTATTIFYWHLLTTLFQPIYLLLILRIRDIRAGKYAHTQALLTIIICIFALNLSVRGVLGILDRGSLAFYISMQYLISLLVVLPVLQRALFVVLPSCCVLFCILFLKSDSSSASHLVAYSMEVIVNGILSFVLSSILFWYFQTHFLNKIQLEHQNTTLQTQQSVLQTQHDTLAALHTTQAELNTQLVAQQTELVAKSNAQSRQLTTFALQMTKHNQTLQELVTQLQEHHDLLPTAHKAAANRIIRLTQNNISSGDDWARFKVFFEATHPHFFGYLLTHYPDLNSHDTRLLALLSLHLNSKDIAALLAISANSVNTARYRLRRRLNIDTDTDLSAFAQQITYKSADTAE